jgi:hypothetical protein
VALQEVTEADRRRDIAVDRACSFLDSRAALTPEDVAGFFRFWMQRDRYQELGPVQLFITLHFVRYYLSTPRLAATFVYACDSWPPRIPAMALIRMSSWMICQGCRAAPR